MRRYQSAKRKSRRMDKAEDGDAKDYEDPPKDFPTRSLAETEAAHDLLSLSQSLPPLDGPALITTIILPKLQLNYTHADTQTQTQNTTTMLLGDQHLERTVEAPKKSPELKLNLDKKLTYVCTPENSPENQMEDQFFNQQQSDKVLFKHSVQNLVNTTSVIVNRNQIPGYEHVGEDLTKKRKLDGTNYKFRPIRIIYQEPKPKIIFIQNNAQPKESELVNHDAIPPPKIIFVQNCDKEEARMKEDESEESFQNLDKNRKITVDTPPTSEHSSDNDLSSKEGSYTYDDLIARDGRSKNKKSKSALKRDEANREARRSGRGKYSCSDCGKQYATSSNLSRHKQTHRSLDSQLARKCESCGKAYVSMAALAMHQLTHRLAHRCRLCGKLFSRPWLLQGHLRSHTGEKPYGCAHCGKAFADRSNLRAHMQTHNADKRHECFRCGKLFALKSYLNKHLEASCVPCSTSSATSEDKKIDDNFDATNSDEDDEEYIQVI